MWLLDASPCPTIRAATLRRSLTTEQLPIRKKQLYDTFGVDGPIPLIPGAFA